jgi:hypothetical protein
LSNSIRTASVHLLYNSPYSVASPSWLFQRIVPTKSTDVTYFCGMGNSFGYGGIQQESTSWWSGQPYGHVIFSIWDQGTGSLAATVACGNGVTCSDFGGEGTGRKSMLDLSNFPIVGTEYFMATQATSVAGGRMQYTGYFYQPGPLKYTVVQIATYV